MNDIVFNDLYNQMFDSLINKKDTDFSGLTYENQ